MNNGEQSSVQDFNESPAGAPGSDIEIVRAMENATIDVGNPLEAEV
jgi:hypothetical protein